ncbi:hypothetical protein Enr10x_29060 [Gimesia panareensis]|uniref:Uncharacterized protein n=1 Tax=Gimesia panareensis TaxID=2527978 RepID=A0A517Q7L7_9PLAN|nr:hypothetical protein [Gimesia panareensis]QDT27588.1 hypothetical protein Enr10x_29060 [Gimesia panareensis]
MKQLEFLIDKLGNRILENVTYQNEQFDTLTIRRLTERTLIRNVQFLNCSSVGAGMIRKGVFLENVIFSNIDCGDTLFISSESIVNEVRVSGRHPARLVIEPDDNDNYVMQEYSKSEMLIDISEFQGFAVIIGLPGCNIKKNDRQHITIKASWKDEVDWGSLGIGPVSFWRLNLKSLGIKNASEGVFSLPSPEHRQR